MFLYIQGKYKVYNSIFNKLKRKMKKNYFKTYLEENKNNSKKCWSMLKYAIGKMNDKSSLPDSFKMNNQTYTDKAEIAEGFNNFFSKIGHHTTSHHTKNISRHTCLHQSNRALSSDAIRCINLCQKTQTKNKFRI